MEAPSISITSISSPRFTATQISHLQHGSVVGSSTLRQFKAFAKMRAIVVLPTPRVPVNKYAWSKLGGECAVRLYDKSLVIRTTFGPDVFPYEKAFVDQWTSREGVSIIARKISELIDKDLLGVIHVCGERETVFDYAKGLDESRDIGELSVNDVDFDVPRDTSLNCAKYNELMSTKQ